MPSHPRAGILYMLAAMLTFTIVNALIKGTVSRYPINEIVFFRFAFALVPCALIVAMSEGRRGFVFQQPLFQIFRGCLGTIALGFMFYSFGGLPLADAMAIMFSGALFSVVIAIPILREFPSIDRWIAILVGFLGVLIIANPSGNVAFGAALAALVGACLDAFSMVSGRYLTRGVHAKAAKSPGLSPSNVAFYFAVVAAVASGASLFYNGIMPLDDDWWALMFMGLGGGVAQYFIAKAYTLAPTATVAPMIYSSAIWSTLVGYAVWGDFPSVQTLLGMAIVVSCGIYIAIKSR